MNNSLSITYLILIIASLFVSCRGSVKEDKKNNTSIVSVAVGEKYSIDTAQSVITWKGSMLLASKEEHVGYVHLSEGELMVEKGQLVGGKVEINMRTIEYKDKENKNTPIQHLKSPDYFDVEKFPVSKIIITSVSSASGKTIKVSGDLTIKDVTRPVSFPAKMEIKDGILTAEGRLIIDRTDWGIRYRSGKFYDVLADEIVSDDIEFYMKIVANQ